MKDDYPTERIIGLGVKGLTIWKRKGLGVHNVSEYLTTYSIVRVAAM